MLLNRFTAHRTLRPGVARVDATLQDFSFPAHSHHHVCIGLMHNGELDCRYGAHRYAVNAGDLMLVNAGEVLDGRPSGRRWRCYSMLEIDPEAFQSLCVDAVGTDQIEFQRAVIRHSGARDALSCWLSRLLGRNARAEREAAALFVGCISTIAGGTPRPTRTGGLAERIRRRMRDDHCGADSIGGLAVDLGVSRYQLIRAFKGQFGLTPEDYRRQLRIERARTMLTGRRRLAEIAIASGFADQSHMTREFRRLTGISPAAYRRGFL
jgi:AraC-like DNA-binding protein